MTADPLVLDGVSHAYGSMAVLDGVTFSVARHEIVGVVGPSGCGKTTLLNLMAGSLQPTRGAIERRGEVRRVYQQGGLLPWLTVEENIALGLRQVRDMAARRQQMEELLSLIQLQAFAGYYPHQLSGGMQQRAEMARALAGGSEILLLDEPFSALDYLTRLRLRQELARLLEQRPRTVVLVTHDIEEAAQLADRVLVLTERPGHIQYQLVLRSSRPRQPTDDDVVGAVRAVLQELGI